MANIVPKGIGGALVNKHLLDVLDEEGVDPARVLAKFANGTASENEKLRFDAARVLMTYVMPQHRSMDVQKDAKSNQTFNIVHFSQAMPDEARILSEQIDQNMTSRMALNNAAVNRMLKEVKTLDMVTSEAMRADLEKYSRGDE